MDSTDVLSRVLGVITGSLFVLVGLLDTDPRPVALYGGVVVFVFSVGMLAYGVVTAE